LYGSRLILMEESILHLFCDVHFHCVLVTFCVQI
jgi:hypothetical protein